MRLCGCSWSRWLVVMACLTGAGAPNRARAVDYAIDPASAAFLVVTSKAGVAARLAHDHLIAAHTFKATLSAPAGAPEQGRFVLVVAKDALTFDDPADHQRFLAALLALGIRSQPFAPVPEPDRATIRQHALDSSQLDAARYPEIRAEVTELQRAPLMFGGKTFSHTAMVRIAIKDKTVEKRLPANVALVGDELRVECVGRFAFSEFGIEPYSALLGAIRNADPFHIYVVFTARAR